MMRGDDRGVTDVIGFVLIFGLVASTVAIISVNGLSVLEDTRSAEQVNNAERAFDVLADNLADIYQEGAPHRATEISLEKARLNTATAANITVSGVDTASGTRTTLAQARIQPIVWESSQAKETQLAYEFGAVVRKGRQGGLMVNDPPFVFDDERTHLLLVRSTGPEESLSGATIRVRGTKGNRKGSTKGFAFHKDDLSSYSELKITITSPRATVWKQYLTKNDMSCSMDEVEGTDRVSCTTSKPDQLYVTISGVKISLER